jgi:acyl-CoA thioesterase-1
MKSVAGGEEMVGVMQARDRGTTRIGKPGLAILLGLAIVGWTCGARAAAPVHVLILGDSLTSGYGLPAADGFEAQLAAALKAAGANVALIDGAVSGDTSTDAAARLDWVLGGGQVDAAFVEIGGNDALRGLDPAALQHNLTYVLNVLAAKHIPVLLSGMLAPPSYGADYGKAFTAVFSDLGHRPGVIYDPFILAGIEGHPALLQADGIHPDAAGVKLEVARLLPLFLRLIHEAD